MEVEAAPPPGGRGGLAGGAGRAPPARHAFLNSWECIVGFMRHAETTADRLNEGWDSAINSLLSRSM